METEYKSGFSVSIIEPPKEITFIEPNTCIVRYQSCGTEGNIYSRYSRIL